MPRPADRGAGLSRDSRPRGGHTTDRRANPAPGLSAVGFYQANDLKPETVAATVGRVFLGLKLEYAQRHDHPFDKWTQRQAWETAAFFAGVAPLEPEVKPQPGLADVTEAGDPARGLADVLGVLIDSNEFLVNH